MKTKTLLKISVVLMLIFVQIGFCYYAPPDGGSGTWVWFRYTVQVVDTANTPMPNMHVEMTANYSLKMGLQWQDQVVFVSGVTDANGNVTLVKSVDVTNYWPDNYIFIDMSVKLTEPGFSVLSSQGTYTHFPNGSANIVAIVDVDGNGINDTWEMKLAQKFCPELRLNSGDQGVRPVPVEIMDRNGDGILDWQDVYIDINNIDGTGTYLGTFSPKQILVPSNTLADVFPYYEYAWRKLVYIDSNNDGCYSCQGDGYPRAVRYIFPHFEWGNFGDTKPSSWYFDWYSKMAQLSNDSRYNKGTTYVHLFKNGTDIVLQYWFFYPFNAAANRHEGDWEHINVIIDNQNPAKSNLLKVVYYYHEKKIIVEVLNSIHPTVFVGGYTEFNGISGEGSHASYPWPGTWNNINPVGTDEHVDGNGMLINFDSYKNIIILPNISYVDNGHNNFNPFIDSNGNNLNWMLYKSAWGHVLSHPSAGETLFLLFNTVIGHFLDIQHNAGNVAPPGPVQHKEWLEAQ